MKRFTTFTTIALSLLLTSASGVSALETISQTKVSVSLNNSVLVAQAGTFSKFVTAEKDHPTTGTLTIIEKDGKRYIEFRDDFKTVEGPDVKIILHKNAVVPVTVKEEDYTTIASIQSFEGTQRYEIPEGIDVNKYASVAVWCQEFNVTFGYAQL